MDSMDTFSRKCWTPKGKARGYMQCCVRFYENFWEKVSIVSICPFSSIFFHLADSCDLAITSATHHMLNVRHRFGSGFVRILITWRIVVFLWCFWIYWGWGMRICKTDVFVVYSFFCVGRFIEKGSWWL